MCLVGLFFSFKRARLQSLQRPEEKLLLKHTLLSTSLLVSRKFHSLPEDDLGSKYNRKNKLLSEIILNACRVYCFSSVSDLIQLPKIRETERPDKLNDHQTFCYRLILSVMTFLLIFHCIGALKTKVSAALKFLRIYSILSAKGTP